MQDTSACQQIVNYFQYICLPSMSVRNIMSIPRREIVVPFACFEEILASEHEILAEIEWNLRDLEAEERIKWVKDNVYDMFK